MLIVAALLFVATSTASASQHREDRIQTGQITKLRLHIEGIACDRCSSRLRDALKKLDGVVAVEVNAGRTELAVDFDALKLTEQTIRAEVARHGFAVK